MKGGKGNDYMGMNFETFGQKKIPSRVKKKEGESPMDAFLKMIDDLQTPKHKTNHKYRSCFPLI